MNSGDHCRNPKPPIRLTYTIERNYLIDSGASLSLIDVNIISSMREQIEPPDPNLRLVGANGSPLSLLGSIKIPVAIGKLKIHPKVLVAGDIPRGMFILGNDLLGCYKLSLNYSNETFEFTGSGILKWFYKD